MPVYPVKILESSYINHDVKRFMVQKPEGYHFIPGQGTNISIDHPDWKDKPRPFTFTSLNAWPYLEFTIKIYNDRKGVTNQLGKTNAGATLLLHDVFGSIQYKGPGIFLAAGSGITPFIAILRDLFNRRLVAGNSLFLTNKFSDDIIYGPELAEILGPHFVNIFTREGVIGFVERRIDRNFLIEHIRDFSRHFYVCGPEKFVTDICKHLIDLGASVDSLVVEQ